MHSTIRAARLCREARGLPGARTERLVARHCTHAQAGLPADQTLVVRMTGCPNGCARPYMAELGFVGDGPNSYQIWLGSNANQTRLAELYADRCGRLGRLGWPAAAAGAAVL